MVKTGYVKFILSNFLLIRNNVLQKVMSIFNTDFNKFNYSIWAKFHIGEENVDHSDSDEVASDFIAVDRTVHPADDQLAKWNLYSIFNNSLESPIFCKCND
jgi:hypothetical protein